MRNFKTILKLADRFITTAGKLHDTFRDKSPHEALDLLKNNLDALRSPDTLINLQVMLQTKSPGEIYDLLTKSHKNLSAEDALKIAEILTDGKIDKQLPDYLDQKIKAISENKNKDTGTGKRLPPPKGRK